MAAIEYDGVIGGDATAGSERPTLLERTADADDQIRPRAAAARKAKSGAGRESAEGEVLALLDKIEADREQKLAALLTTRPADVAEEQLEVVGLLARQAAGLRHDLPAVTGRLVLGRPWDFAKRLGPFPRRPPGLAFACTRFREGDPIAPSPRCRGRGSRPRRPA